MEIKETKDCLEALNILSIEMIKLFKKHAGAAEIAAALLSDDALKAALLAAYEGVSSVPAELKDIDVAEGLSLAVLQVQYVPKLIEALKG